MIRSNLATRPFYNDRAVRFWLVLAAVLVAAATVVNVSRMIYYSRSDTELARQAANDEERTRLLRRDATALRASVDAKQIEVASVEARQANDLIDRRTFSWTDLFNQFEATLPPNVRITSVQPQLDENRRMVMRINVVAQSVADVDQFMANLDQVGAFTGLLSNQERVNESGQLEASLETVYTPNAPTPPSAAQPSPPAEPGAATP